MDEMLECVNQEGIVQVSPIKTSNRHIGSPSINSKDLLRRHETQDRPCGMRKRPVFILLQRPGPPTATNIRMG